MSNAVIEIRNLSKIYRDFWGRKKVQAVKSLSMDVMKGEVFGLLGPNGSGKTTLMNLMTGLVRPTRGTIRVLGVSPQDPERLFKLVGYSTQFDSYPRGMTGFEFIQSYLRQIGRAHV